MPKNKKALKSLTKYGPLDLRAVCTAIYKKLRIARVSNIEQLAREARNRVHRKRRRQPDLAGSFVETESEDKSGARYLRLSNGQVIRPDKFLSKTKKVIHNHVACGSWHRTATLEVFPPKRKNQVLTRFAKEGKVAA